MKKVLFLLAVFLIILFSSNEKIEYAFKENVEGYYQYELIFENKELSTVNFETYFSNLQVLTIFPEISPLYKNQFPFLNYSFDTYRSISDNLSRFQNKYIHTLENSGYRKEALKAKMSGIIIAKVIIYSEENNIIYLRQQFLNMQYRRLDRDEIETNA